METLTYTSTEEAEIIDSYESEAGPSFDLAAIGSVALYDTEAKGWLDEAYVPAWNVEPAVADFATSDIKNGFDWDGILDGMARNEDIAVGQPLYLVVFRSQLKEGADTQLLAAADAEAHDAAKESPALIHYFGGTADEAGNNMSFCLWSDVSEARRTVQDPRHVAAMELSDEMYDSVDLSTFKLTFDGREAVFEPLVRPGAGEERAA